MKADERMSPNVSSCEAACLGFARPESIVSFSLSRHLDRVVQVRN